ncbi:MAG: sn-glycerol-3-phosphate ABC transporter ATP-binding protein UgpC [Clostridia bacterium]|nr:sn-glycerol-3-phosphate ABC transporter ATP-binding protein UgpC [Clostridia bacterium]
MASLSLRHIYKIYQGGVKAVSDFNLEIDDKEFIVFVGPSGCGKSTTLRMVAGLEEISAGELYIDNKLVNDVEPKDRDIAMVFQNYALYPHMTVYDNMAFGLKLRKMPSKEIEKRVNEAAAILGISQLLTRKPKALSGGQRQRVALGRAIVREPKVFLLDEPLSNLDAKLRVQMRTEITKLHNKLATTFIYVTHDQTEAMTMGTRIVVMKDGIIQQIDTPTCLYDNPENLFVASFLGSPQMNFFKAQLVKEGDKLYSVFGSNKILVPESRAKRIIDDYYIGKDVVMGVRPEDIHDEQIFISSNPDTVINAEIDVIEKLGNETILYMKVDGKEDYTVARIDARSQFAAGEQVSLAIDANHIHFFDPDTELTIMGVPKANRIAAKLLATEEGLKVRFGNVVIPVSEATASRMTDLEQINRDITLEIAPGDLTDVEEEGCVKIDGTVDFVEKYPRYTAAFSVVPGKKGFLVSKHAVDSAVAPGDKIALYLRPEDIQMRDIDENEKILAHRPVGTNTAAAMITVKESKDGSMPAVATISFGKSKLHMITNSEVREPSGESTVVLNIDPRAVRVGKEEVAKDPKMVVVGRVKDADVLGANTIVYADVEGLNDVPGAEAPNMQKYNFCAIVPGTVNYNVNDKVKFAINPQGITLGQKDSVGKVIADKVAFAPEYVFVEDKKPSVKAAENVSDNKKNLEEMLATQSEEEEEKKPAPKKTASKKKAEGAIDAATVNKAKKTTSTAAKKPAAAKPKKPAPKK